MRRYVSLGSIRQLILKPYLLAKIPAYLGQLRAYRKLELSSNGKNEVLRLYPCLTDDVHSQSAHSAYFYQDCWAARQVFREKPAYVVDIGSTVLLSGIVSQFTKCVSVDIRPVCAELEGLSPVQASVLQLPFGDDAVPCVTTMCVLEHVGLGRYGDQINPKGTEQAVVEISRVLAPGGTVTYSVPVGREVNEFNAHRRFAYQQAANFFKGWELVDSCVLTPSPVPHISEDAIRGGNDLVACFCYRKPEQ